MSYLKLRYTRRGSTTLTRVFAGPSYEDTRYSGTLVLPTPDFEQFLDCLVHGAAQLGRDDTRLHVYFGPDE